MTPSEKNFEPFFRKMAAENLPDIVINSFRHDYAQLVKGRTGLIPESEIIPMSGMADIEKLPREELAEAGAEKMRQAVVIKLNGGLGTSMGMKCAKSLLKVKDSLSFLDIIIRQAKRLDGSMPVIFMNGFSTRPHTLDALKAYPELHDRNLPVDFLQHKVPKVHAEDLGPAVCPENPKLEWCPPGHGDIYNALAGSGMLDRLLEEGYEYAFVSNADNLGAVFDPAVFSYFVRNGLSFLMEAADRTEADKKGGHLAQSTSGRYVLREVAQCPEADMDAFQDIHRHRYFNTNNIWLHLPSVKDLVNEQNGVLGLPMIRNRKNLDPRDPESPPVYQLETAMGAAISVFDRAGAIRVPRTRFAPVKNTNDLLAVRSDRFLLDDRFRLLPNPNRRSDRILIDLAPAHYKRIDDFESRFPFGPPSLTGSESLTIHGDFTFGRNVTLKGDVNLINDTGEPFAIDDGREIQGKFRVGLDL